MAKLPKMLKPATGGEEIFRSNHRVLRGDWRWRVRKDKSRNLRDPKGDTVIRGESDSLIVAKKGLTSLERRRLTVNTQLLR